MSPAELLGELTRQGIELRADGNRLRYRPRAAVSPELAETLRTHKGELLTLLRGDGQRRAPAAASPPGGGTGPPEPLAGNTPPDVPHELSFLERIETGYVNPGWSARGWRDRLLQMAGRCEAVNPGLAASYREWASNIDVAHGDE